MEGWSKTFWEWLDKDTSRVARIGRAGVENFPCAERVRTTDAPNKTYPSLVFRQFFMGDGKSKETVAPYPTRSRKRVALHAHGLVKSNISPQLFPTQ